MKKFMFITLMVLTVLANAQEIRLNPVFEGFNMISSTDQELVITSSIAAINTFRVRTDEGVFVQLQIDQYSKNNDFGKAMLPVISKLIEIPVDAKAEVTILSYKEEIVDLNQMGISHKIMPVQPSLNKSTDPTEVEFLYDKDYYSDDVFSQGPVVTAEQVGIMRGTNIGRLTIKPFSYNPVQNILIIYNDIEVSVRFVNGNTVKTEQLKKKFFSPVFESTLKSKVINYKAGMEKDMITNYPIKYVIVSSPLFETALQPFIQWKTRKGFHVVEAYTDDPGVGTTTTSIKAYLQNLYNSGTPTDPAPTYILFVGDVAQIPAFSGTSGSHITDLYYCEYDGGTDVIADVYYGRFSATNLDQLQPQIDKTLEYEQYLMPDPSFLDKCVMVAGVDGSMAPTYGNGQINYGNQYYFNAMHGYSTNYTYLYGSGSPILSNDPGASAAIIGNVSAGVGFVNYTAHCGPSGWSDPGFTTSNIPGLANAHMYPLSIGNCCLSNKFDETECFGEALLRATNKGALGHIGGSNSTYWDEDFWWSVGATTVSANPSYDTHLGAYDLAFHDNGEPESSWYISNGQIIHSGNLAVIEGNGAITYYWEIYHLMGDPSIMTYFSVPAALTASYINPVPIGTTSLTVTTEDYAYVAISENNILLDAQYTGTGTSVTLNFPAFVSPGQADIVVTKQNRAPYIGILDIVSANTTNDAQCMNIIYPMTYHSILNADVSPKVVIRNMGQANLTSADVSYQIDGGSITNFSWTGNLIQYATDTVTFSQITLPAGTHLFTSFTSNPNGVADEFTPGDTINRTFTVTAGDGRTLEILSLDDVYCDAVSYTPAIVISNPGQVEITQMNVNYQIDNGAIETYNWTGSLLNNQKDTVFFTPIMLAGGSHIFKAFTSSPNGGTDDNPSNDTTSQAFEVYVNAQLIQVSITTDWFGDETTWVIRNDVTHQVLYSGGPYDNSTSYNEVYCMGEGCYTFTIYDAYGDGICCNWGTGSFTISNTTTSDTYGTGGTFNDSANVAFCVDPVSIEKNSTRGQVFVYPNPANDFIVIDAVNFNIEEISMLDITGKVIMAGRFEENRVSIDMSAYSQGVYYLKIKTGDTIFSEKLILTR